MRSTIFERLALLLERLLSLLRRQAAKDDVTTKTVSGLPTLASYIVISHRNNPSGTEPVASRESHCHCASTNSMVINSVDSVVVYLLVVRAQQLRHQQHGRLADDITNEVAEDRRKTREES